jgi:hypothetical protein
MKRAAIAAALVLALGGTAIAIAQPGEGGLPEDPGAIAEGASSFGQCVSDASGAGVENPAEACSELKPDPEGQGNGDEGAGNDDDTFAAQCAGESKEDGSFGECVAEHASAFGQCVRANAEAGVVNPAAACADEFPGHGQPGNGTIGGPPEGTPSGPPEGTPSGPPEGTPSGPPEGTPSGPPEGTPSGPPEGTPSGPPEGTPSGPPEGTPGGGPNG